MLQRFRSTALTLILAGAFAIPGSASPTGDATYSLASYKAMAAAPEPGESPRERLIAVYMASAERMEMLSRLQERYPALIR